MPSSIQICRVFAVLPVLGVAGPSAAAAGLPGGGSTQPPGAGYRSATAYRLPVEGTAVVLRPFQGPAGPYAAGHRGVDLAAGGGGAVFAAAAGTVSFAGVVAGRGVVVIAHADGIRTEYEPVEPTVQTGQAVAAGAVIGVVDGVHPGCPNPSCLHWGARRGATYFDPMSLLRPLGIVHLIPLVHARGCACRYAWRSRSTET